MSVYSVVCGIISVLSRAVGASRALHSFAAACRVYTFVRGCAQEHNGRKKVYRGGLQVSSLLCTVCRISPLTGYGGCEVDTTAILSFLSWLFPFAIIFLNRKPAVFEMLRGGMTTDLKGRPYHASERV